MVRASPANQEVAFPVLEMNARSALMHPKSSWRGAKAANMDSIILRNPDA
jgi:hypothetical protein